MPIPSLSVVVPLYNSAGILPKLLDRLQPVLAGLGIPYEVVLVDDGSRDASFQVLQAEAKKRPWVRGFRLMRNYGQHNALLCAIRHARHAVVVTIDDDLQHPPEEIPRLLAKLDEGFDVVYGSPAVERHGLLRDLASRVTKFALQKSMGVETARHVSAFRALRTELRKAFDNYQGQFVSIDVLLTWSTTRFTAIEVRHDARQEGVSNYTLRKLFTHTMNMLTGFSVFPLQLASVIGFVFTLFGLLVLAYVLVAYLVRGSAVPGFPFLASVVAIFSGAQMFAIGIIGEYLARMHFRMMDRPSYSLREATEEPGPG